jgi:hypothetical protein
MILQRLVAVIFVLALSLTSISVGYAKDKAATPASFGETEALNLAQQWALLVGQANVPDLEKLLDDKYLHIHGTALVESKAKFLEAFKTGARKYDPISLEEVEVRVFGNSAIVTGKFNLKAYVRDKTIEGVNRFGLVMVKGEGGQKIVSFQATAIPQTK